MLFSIIIPTYNRADLIPETIRSVQNQTFKDWECIIVDDGSTDNTKSIIEDLIKQDSRIKYVYQENAERSAAS
jgi:glycosyltransferase involved in cell wall biosynthesis